MACPPGMRGCAITCGHRQWVEGYRDERQRQEIVAENVSLGYDTEHAEWLADHPLPTLKQWMKHREKAPEKMVNQPLDREVATDARRLANWDRNAEQDHARAQWTADRKGEDAVEAAEMRRYLAFDPDTATVQEARAYHEQSLLGGAMLSDGALPALEVVQDEFSEAFHANVARAILDQARDGAPHDADAVEAVLRERKVYSMPDVLAESLDARPYGPYYPAIENANQPNRQWAPEQPETPSQLPAPLDPDKSLAPVDHVQYGLRTWEQGAVPGAEAAAGHASKIRQYHRGDYLQQVSAKLAQATQVAMESGEDPGYEMLDAARDLTNMPPKLGPDLRPTKDFISRDVVDTAKPVRVATTHSEATTLGDLGLPPRPVLSAPVRAVASA